MTGVGSAIPANQRQAGISQPEAAARAAADPNSTARRVSEEAERVARREARTELILDAWGDGLIFKDADRTSVISTLQEASDGQLIRWEEEIDEARREQIDDEEASRITQAARALQIQPDDLQYNFVYDRELRKRIEADLEPLDFTQMVFEGYAEQTVKIRDNFKVTFRTVNGMHALWLERRLHEVNAYAQQYGQHWYTLHQLAVCVQSINGRPIGPDLSSFTDEAHEDKFNDQLKVRLKAIKRMPTEISDLLIANMAWFTGRVRKDLVGDLMDRVGNS